MHHGGNDTPISLNAGGIMRHRCIQGIFEYCHELNIVYRDLKPVTRPKTTRLDSFQAYEESLQPHGIMGCFPMFIWMNLIMISHRDVT